MKPRKLILILFSSFCLVALVLGSGQPLLTQAATTEFDLWVELKAPEHVAPGSQMVINLSYANKGTSATPDDLTIKVVLPEGLSFVSAVDKIGESLPVDPTANPLTWEVDGLPADSTWQHIWITTEVDESLTEWEELTTVVDISPLDSNTPNNHAEVTSLVCDMAGSKKEANVDQAKPGDVIRYTITLRLAQRSTSEAGKGRNVTLTDLLPPATQVRFLGWDVQPPGATYDPEQHRLNWQGSVGPDESLTFQYRLGVEGDFPPGEFLQNRVGLQWSGGGMDLPPVETLIVLTDDDHMFGPGGGEWRHTWGLALEVPPGAVQEQTRFEFKPLSGAPDDPPPGWSFANRAFELNAYRFGEVNQFKESLELRLQYKPGDIGELYRNSLRLFYRNRETEAWKMLGEPLQNSNGEITFQTNHFTQFALFGKPEFQVMVPLVLYR